MIRFRDVSKSYGSNHALRELSFACRKGEVLGLLGPNGAGKSTTVSIAVGITKPDAGSVEIDVDGQPHPPSHPEARAALGVATQRLALYPSLTVVENLRFFARVLTRGRTAKQQIRERVDRAIERVSLQASINTRVKRLSHGTAQRANLAAALIHNPSLVLLDEPTAGLDPASRRDVHDMVTALRQEGCAIIYTTHHMDEAERLCDRVLLIHEGQRVALEDVHALVGRFNAATDHHPRSHNQHQPTPLERAFFELTKQPDAIPPEPIGNPAHPEQTDKSPEIPA